MSNPFDPFGAPAPAAAPPAAPQYGMPPAQSPTGTAASNFSYGSTPSQGYPPQQQQQQYGQQPGYPAAPAPQAAPPTYGQQNQMVVAQQQSNPYGGFVAPAPPAADPMMQQSMVPAAQPPQGQWGMQQMPPQQQQQPGYPAPAPAPVGGALFDPLAPPPADPFMSQSLVPAHAPVPPPAAAPPQQPVYDAPFGNLAPPPAAQPPRASPPPADVVESQREAYEHPGNYGRQDNYGPPRASDRQGSGDGGSPSRNPYSNQLARTVAGGASPLPKAELVKKKGWILSRISFRTILTKKWKQSYWVQYGSHTMLWFRSQQDFDDWLNNPYHNQAQRNFLIKLAVNFVHDLYKPNVRGYQVTQCRVKPYGNKMVRQFKLERWMDYGPTIAAAFGAYDPKEVDTLRASIVECMKNTPLEGGVRATGAVKQHHEEQAAKRREADTREHNGQSNGHGNNGYGHSQSTPEFPAPSGGRSVASVDDLLDTHNTFDEAASYPNMPAYGGAPDPSQQAFAAYTQQSFGAPAPPPASVPPQPYGQPYPAPAAPAPFPAQAPPQPPQYGYGQPQPPGAPQQYPQQYPQQTYGQF